MHAMLAHNDSPPSAETDQETSRLVRLHASSSSGPTQIVVGDGLWEVLKDCADAIGRADWQRAIQELAALSSKASPQGDANERLAFYFCNALSCRIHERRFGESLAIRAPVIIPQKSSIDQGRQAAAYLALNRATPFVRFAHLTANQAILELALELGEEVVLHIVDLDINQGLQWPPLMQALSNRSSGAAPRLRISGFGASIEELEKTGIRLAEFARSLDFSFSFNAVAERIEDFCADESLKLELGEVIAVNLPLQLHRLRNLGSDCVTSLMETIRSLKPKVVTVADQLESSCTNHSSLADRLKESLSYYTAIFESLEATLPASSTERLQIEEVMLGEEILYTVATCEDHQRMKKHQNFAIMWKEWLERTGFRRVAPSAFAVAQAKLLLRLHYPAGGYKLFEEEHRLLLACQEKPVLAVSSWQP